MLLGFAVLLVVNKVAYVELVRNPLCVQIQAGHQRSRLVCRGAVLIGVPAAEGVVFTSRQLGIRIVERLIVGAGSSGANLGLLSIAKVRMVGDSNVYILNVAVDMIAVGLLFNGIPNNLSNLRIELFTEQSRDVSDIGGRSVVCAVPVGLGEETEVSRQKQIFAFNANVINLGIAVRGIVAGVLGISNRLACLGQIAFVAVSSVSTGNAAVRSGIRQVICRALAFAALRNAARRQKYEILSRGQFRFRFGFRLRSFLGGKLCVQSQIVIRHRVVFPLVHEICIGVPTLENAVILLNCRSGNRRMGINRTEGVRAVSARDGAAVQIVSQLHRLNVRGDVNLDGSVALGLAKIETESVLAVFIGDSAQSQRVECYAVDGVIGVIANLTNTNRRNRKGLVVPECPASNGLIGTVFVTVLDVNLIGHAAALTILCIFLVNRPVGNIDLNHLRILSTNQIVEYQLVGPSIEFSPLGRALCTVLKLALLAILVRRVSNAGNFGTVLGLVIVRPGGLVQYVLHASLPENGVVVAVRGRSIALIRHDIGDSKTVGIRDAVAVRGDFQRAGAVRNCAAVGNPILSINRLNVVQAISVDVQRCHC